MYPPILGSFVGFCTPLSACQPPFLLRGREVGAREGRGDCLGKGGEREGRGDCLGVVVVGVEYSPGVAGGGVDWGRVGVVILGWGGNRFCGRFLGRGRVFRWRVVWLYRKIFFAVVRPLKRLFDSARPTAK